MEPKNYPIEKESHLPNLHFLGFMFIFMGAGRSSIRGFSPDLIAPGSCPRTHIRRCNNHVFWGEPKRVENSGNFVGIFIQSEKLP